MSGCKAIYLYGSEGVTVYCTVHGALATLDHKDAAEDRFNEHVAAEADDAQGRWTPLAVDDPRRLDHTMTVLGTAAREAGPWMSDALYEAINHALWALGKARGSE